MLRCSRLVLGALTLGVTAGCSSDSATEPNPDCDVTNPVSRIAIAPTSATIYFRVPVRATDTLHVTPTAYNRFGGERTDVRFAYVSSDTGVVVVEPTGLVRVAGAGTATITASACGESASARVEAVPAIATVTVGPTPDTLVAGDSLLLTARAIDHAGASMLDAVFQWSDPPDRPAVLRPASDSAAWVFTKEAGLTPVTATTEGASGSASVVVLPRVFLPGDISAMPGLDAGADVTCAAITLGRTYCWGASGAGQLGPSADSVCFGTVQDSLGQPLPGEVSKSCSLAPVRLSSDLSFAGLAVGRTSACGITLAGQLYCWGANDQGQLGNGLAGASAAPTLVTGAFAFRSVVVGGQHACALTTDGAAYCWGSDAMGQLGDARTISSTTPIPVVADTLTGRTVRFTALSAGLAHTCGISTEGVTYCWGDNAWGQLGATTAQRCGNVSCSSVPVPVNVPVNTRFAALTAGADHTCALTDAGAAYCWGNDSTGQLGDRASNSTRPTPVPVFGGHVFRQITAGTRYTCALDGTAAWCWGDDADLQLGRGPYSGGDAFTASPVMVAGGHAFERISAGLRHTCAVTVDGHAFCWGSNVFGALGNTLQAAYRGIPQEVATPR